MSPKIHVEKTQWYLIYVQFGLNLVWKEDLLAPMYCIPKMTFMIKDQIRCLNDWKWEKAHILLHYLQQMEIDYYALF